MQCIYLHNVTEPNSPPADHVKRLLIVGFRFELQDLPALYRSCSVRTDQTSDDVSDGWM